MKPSFQDNGATPTAKKVTKEALFWHVGTTPFSEKVNMQVDSVTVNLLACALTDLRAARGKRLVDKRQTVFPTKRGLAEDVESEGGSASTAVPDAVMTAGPAAVPAAVPANTSDAAHVDVAEKSHSKAILEFPVLVNTKELYAGDELLMYKRPRDPSDVGTEKERPVDNKRLLEMHFQAVASSQSSSKRAKMP